MHELNPTIIAALIGAAATLIVGFISVFQAHKSRTLTKQGGGIRPIRATGRHPRAYRKALLKDERIAKLQILGMREPLKVSRIYVPIRLHPDTSLGYKLDPELLEAEAQRDPNALIRAEQERLENRFRTASDPIEAIRTKRRCIILGDPGAGKTTLLKYLALRSANKQLTGLPDLPIHIELNAFANSKNGDLLDFAATTWEDNYGIPKENAQAYIEKHLHAGNALLLLDALDEAGSGETGDVAEASYKRIVDAIQKIATRFPALPIVVTARKAGYYQSTIRLTGFTELEVLDFRPRDIRRFVNDWFSRYHDPQKRAKREDLNTKLERHPRIKKLAATPLLLTLIVLSYERQLELPDRRAELYKQCVDSLLTMWDASRDIHRRREFKPEHKRLLLEEVAWHFHNQGLRYFPESELLAVIADFLPTVGLPRQQNRLVLDEIAVENGLLKEQAKGWYGFFHLSLQEYFVALQASDQNQIDTLLAHRGEPWWEEVILLYAGHTSDASLLLQKLIELSDHGPLQEDIFHTNLILAGDCLATHPVVRQTSLREEITFRLFNTLTNTLYASTRQRIVQTLVAIDETDVNMHLLALLSDQQLNPSDRQFIARTLGESNDRSLPPQLTSLLSDQRIDSAIRKDIAFALNRLSQRSLVTITLASTLLSLLSEQQLDPETRTNIAYALGNLEEHSLVPKLLLLLSNLQIDWKVRRGIAYALGRSYELSVVLKLLPLLFDQKIELYVRRSIARILVELGQFEIPLLSKLPKLISQGKIARFVPRRINYIFILIWLLSYEKLDPYIRGSIALDLGRLRTTYRVRKLRQRLSNKQLHPYVRGSVVQALAELGKPDRVVSKLERLLFDAQLHLFVRWSIALALGYLNEPSTIPKLQSLLSDSQLDPLFCASLAKALGDLDEPSVAPKLVQLLSDTQLDLLLYRSCVDALGNLSKRSGGTEVLQDLSHLQTDCVVRVSLADVLGKLGNRSVVPNMLSLLSDSQLEPIVRQGIAEALGELGSPSIAPQLLSLLSNSQLEPDVCKQIANAIAKLGKDEAIVRELYTLLQTQTSDIADSIYRALWTVSRRAGIRIFTTDGPAGKQIEVVKWGIELKSKDKQ